MSASNKNPLFSPSSSSTRQPKQSSSSSSSQQQQQQEVPPPPSGNKFTIVEQIKSFYEENQKEIVVVISSVCTLAIVIRALQISKVLYASLLPLGWVYLVMNCPPPLTFDTKKELEKVLKQDLDLPDDHPNRPKNLIEKWTIQAKAKLTTELATLPGYQVESLPLLAGACIWTTVSLPSVNQVCYWIGMNQKWYYIGSCEQQTTTAADKVEEERRKKK
jgi:hypothetical protein